MLTDKIRGLLLNAQRQAAQETIANSFAYENLVMTKFANAIVEECANIANVKDPGLAETIRKELQVIQ